MDKQQIATFLKRFPWTGRLALVAWRRLRQPWVTAGVVGAIFNDAGQMLLVEHVFHPEFPWGLPGGWMSKNEDPARTITREAQEETNLRIHVLCPLLIVQSPKLHNHLDIAYLCYAPSGEICLSSELLRYQWVDPAALPFPLLQFHTLVIDAAINQRSKLKEP